MLAKPEVGKSGVPVYVDHHVLGLDVPVHQVQLVQVLYGQEDFGRIEPRLVLVHRPVAFHVREKVTAAHVRHDEVQVTVVLVEVLHINGEREIDGLQNPFLVFRPLHLRYRAYVRLFYIAAKTRRHFIENTSTKTSHPQPTKRKKNVFLYIKKKVTNFFLTTFFLGITFVAYTAPVIT